MCYLFNFQKKHFKETKSAAEVCKIIMLKRPNSYTDLKSFETFAHSDFQNAFGVKEDHRALYFHIFRSFFNSFHDRMEGKTVEEEYEEEVPEVDDQGPTMDELRDMYGGGGESDNEFS